jgi:hypothetical protein
MAIKLADLSFIRRSPAEISVLRELISLKRSKVAPPSEGYVALRCQMKEEQLRKVLGKLVKSCLISYDARERDTRGYKETFYDYVLHYRHIQRLIDEGEMFIHKTLQERYANSQRGKEFTTLGESITEKEGETKGVITNAHEATAINPRALAGLVQSFPRDAPEVLDGFSLFREQPKYKDLSESEAWIEFYRSGPGFWIKKAEDAKAAKRNTNRT